MKKTFALICLAALFCAVSGCSKRPRVPDKTVLAAYVDIEKAQKHGQAFAEAAIAALPSEPKQGTKAKYEEFLGEINELIDSLHPKWIVVAYGGTLRDLKELSASPAKDLSFVIKIDASDDRASEILAKMAREGAKPEKTDDGEVYESDAECYGRIGGDYLIFGASPPAFASMYDLYRKSGGKKGKTSADFDDLTRLPGDAFVRVSTAPISGLIERFELTKSVQDFGERCKDKRLAGLLLGMGAVTIDVTANKDALATTLRIACESTKDAKFANGIFQTIAFSSRAICDIASYFAADPDSSKKFAEKTRLPESSLNALVRQADVLHNGIQTIEADRNGKIAEISMSLTADSPLVSAYAVPFFMKCRNDARAEKKHARAEQPPPNP